MYLTLCHVCDNRNVFLSLSRIILAMQLERHINEARVKR